MNYPPDENQDPEPDEIDEEQNNSEMGESNISEDDAQENLLEEGATNINITDTNNSHINIDTGDKIILEIPPFLDLPGQGIKVFDLETSEINKIQSVYVEPPRFSDNITRILNERLIIILGNAHSGKYAAALQISQKLTTENSDLKIRSLRFSEDASLIDFVENEKCPANSIFVVQDGFSVPGLGITEIQRHAPYLVALLGGRNNYVIITTDINVLGESEIPEKFKVEQSPFSASDLQKIFKKHLAYYELSESAKTIIEEKRPQIVSALRSAHAIDRFFQIISRDTLVTTGKVDEVLTKIVNATSDAKSWFQSLGTNQKYYAMLVSLCRGLNRNQLWVVYEKIFMALKSKKVNIDTPLNFSEEELRSTTYTALTDIGTLEFQDSVYGEQVLLQVRDAYLQQFRFLLPVFSEIVLDNASNQGSQNRDMRISLAIAIGEIAKTSWSDAFKIFDIWANHQEITIKSAVAHSIRQTATDNTRQKDIAFLLSKWKSSPNANLRWTSAAISERLYPVIPQEALGILDELSNDRSNFVRRAVVHAVAAVARRDLEEAIQTILDWVNTERKRTKRTAGDVFIRLLENSKRLAYALSDEAYRIRLIPLVTELIVQGDVYLEKGLSLLREWIVSGNENKELLDSIEGLLLEACATVPVDIRQGIVDEIRNKWIQSEDESLYRFSVVLVDLIQKLPEPEEPQIPTQYFIFDDGEEESNDDDDFVIHNTD